MADPSHDDGSKEVPRGGPRVQYNSGCAHGNNTHQHQFHRLRVHLRSGRRLGYQKKNQESGDKKKTFWLKFGFVYVREDIHKINSFFSGGTSPQTLGV